jgi:SNF2 family DNA or RNA helicase
MDRFLKDFRYQLAIEFHGLQSSPVSHDARQPSACNGLTTSGVSFSGTDIAGNSSIDWQTVIAAPPILEVDALVLLHGDQATPVVSATFRRRSAKITSYFFSDLGLSVGSQTTSADDSAAQASLMPDVARPKLLEATDPNAGAHESAAKSEPRRTRIEPPADMIKLQDRLFYLLQPPLESLLDGKTMEFPFEPFPFQFAGIGFLFPRYHAILADEMGLGKTMQTITAIRMLLRTGHAGNVLLICPKPLVTNWLREFQTWAPEIPVAAISGSQQQRAWHWTSNPALVKIANYELLTRDESFVTNPNRIHDLVVLDEAQRVKNKGNSTSQIVHKIPRKRSWALTGTPIENGLDDLIGICEFTSPGLLHSGMTTREVRGRVSDLILRRTKDLVMKDMPPRLMRDAELELTAEQWESYQSAENDGVIRLNEMGDELSIKHVFELVLRLKQICNFDPISKSSSKMERLVADLEEVAASGQKAIVFSQWVDALELIAEQIPQHAPLQFHGRIPSGQRDPILREFRENPDRKVILMSYGAGSVGLNLQFCRYVFLFDRWWNPAIEDQAINRAHRIGAAGSVTVTRMIMSGTIEQRIHSILEEKRQLFREILTEDASPNKRGLTREEIFGLFNLRTPQGKISPRLNVA